MNRIYPFRWFWSQKVLPLVYDDSLSYYEVLTKLVFKVNELIEGFNDEFQTQLREYLNQVYLDVMYDNGTLIMKSGLGELADSSIWRIQLGDKTYPIVDSIARDLISQLTDTVGENYRTLDGKIDDTKHDLEEEIDEDVRVLREEIDAVEEQLPEKSIESFRSVRYYVDVVNGDDDNDGRTANNAFRTLNKAFSLFNKYSALWIYLVTAGTYEVDWTSIYSEVDLHLSAMDSNIRVLFTSHDTSDNGIAVYSGHWNIKTMDDVPGERMHIQARRVADSVYPCHLYFDGCSCLFTDIEFDDFVAFYGGSADFEGCGIYQIAGYNADLSIMNGTIIKNTEYNKNALYFRNCQIYLTGTFESANLSQAQDSDHYYLSLLGCHAFVGSLVLSDNTNKYNYAVRAVNGGSLQISSARLAVLEGRATNGNTIDASVALNDYA